MTELEQLAKYSREATWGWWGWREERGPGWETGDSAADQLWDPATFFLSLGLHRKELTDGVHHLWLNQSESPSTGME